MRYKGCHQAHNAKVVICAIFTTPNSLKLQERRKAFSPIRKVRAISQKLYSHSQPPNPHSARHLATPPAVSSIGGLRTPALRVRRATFMGPASANLHIFASRFWRLQSPLFLHERTSLVATCLRKLAERPRPPKLAERRRKEEGASDTHHDLDGRDGFRESSTHPAICCQTGCLICLSGKSAKTCPAPFAKIFLFFRNANQAI